MQPRRRRGGERAEDGVGEGGAAEHLGARRVEEARGAMSTSRFVASARSRLYVGVFTWSSGTFMLSPPLSLRTSWYTKFFPTFSGPYTTVVRG